MDPMSLVMLGLIGLLIIFMVRNGRKRREQMSQMQEGIVPGAQVMLQSGIFGTVDNVDEDDANRVTIVSGTSTFVVHRNAIGNIITPQETFEEHNEIAPDDDPEFGEGLSDESDNKPDADRP